MPTKSSDLITISQNKGKLIFLFVLKMRLELKGKKYVTIDLISLLN